MLVKILFLKSYLPSFASFGFILIHFSGLGFTPEQHAMRALPVMACVRLIILINEVGISHRNGSKPRSSIQ